MKPPALLGRWMLPILLLATLLAGCANNPERLPELDRRFYYNLPTADAQQQFLELAPEQRQAFLEDHGLWQKWAALPPEQRKAITDGRVDVGFHEFAVFMAWGPPADTQVRETRNRRVEFHTFIRCTSGPKTGRYVRSNLECEGTSSETTIAVENGVVTEIKYGP